MKPISILSMIAVTGVLGCGPQAANNDICDATEGQTVTVETESESIHPEVRIAANCISGKVKTESVDTIPEGYKPVTDSLVELSNVNGIHLEYFLYDITGDGMPELWIKTGICEADYRLAVYAVANGKSRQILDSDGGHIEFFLKGNTIGSATCNSGSGYVTIYNYNGKNIAEKSAEFSIWNDRGKAIATEKDGQKIIDFWLEKDTDITFKSIM